MSKNKLCQSENHTGFSTLTHISNNKEDHTLNEWNLKHIN